jgi:hypothetical protein
MFFNQKDQIFTGIGVFGFVFHFDTLLLKFIENALKF